VHIGHINLTASFNGVGANFVALVESLQHHALQQYILVRNIELAKRLAIVEGVTVGPVVRTPLTAYCLMPQVDVVHIHDQSSRTAGILLALTRSVPYVLTQHETKTASDSPLNRSARKRASGFIADNEVGICQHLQVYRRAMDSLRIPTVLL